MTVNNPASPVVIPANGNPVAVTPAINDPATFEVFNDGTRTVWWGGAGVTSATGVPIAVNTGRVFDLQPTDQVSCCTDGAGAGEVRVGEVNG